ncbi:MAG: purine-nucleoside phosphorylase [Legionellaceae bacterium]|nr:purine-nucleoside phosphorylase [Legionellaceae bacterium]|tara:strand:- start:1043 stop:1570 length:528 start_codon:yes stop_codon:yes gene_type:complete
MSDAKPKILISACLLGQKVRYDGKDNLQSHPRLQRWIVEGRVVTVCPEMAGGLPTPRPPSEIQLNKTADDVLSSQGKVTTVEGDDVTAEYVKGAQVALKLAQDDHICVAILKARSPSCGSTQRYDGTFSNTLVDGMGVTAALLLQHDIQVFDESRIDEALDAALESAKASVPGCK